MRSFVPAAAWDAHFASELRFALLEKLETKSWWFYFSPKCVFWRGKYIKPATVSDVGDDNVWSWPELTPADLTENLQNRKCVSNSRPLTFPAWCRAAISSWKLFPAPVPALVNHRGGKRPSGISSFLPQRRGFFSLPQKSRFNDIRLLQEQVQPCPAPGGCRFDGFSCSLRDVSAGRPS